MSIKQNIENLVLAEDHKSLDRLLKKKIPDSLIGRFFTLTFTGRLSAMNHGLFMAASHNKLPAIEVLLQYGAYPLYTDPDTGRNCFEEATYNGYESCATRLQEAINSLPFPAAFCSEPPEAGQETGLLGRLTGL